MLTFYITIHLKTDITPLYKAQKKSVYKHTSFNKTSNKKKLYFLRKKPWIIVDEKHLQQGSCITAKCNM